MRTNRVKIADLYHFEGEPPPENPDFATITMFVLKRFGFLPKPIGVVMEGDEVVISYPEESEVAQMEAERLAERAGKRAAEGHYEKAVGILKRALELQPSLHGARRDLAMAYVELGDIDNATNHLIEVLRLNPGDAWSWVVLANLYIQQKSDKETGEKFLRRALEIAPNDAWALNSLAAVTFASGKSEEAIALFERATAANPEFANAYYGEAIAYHKLNQSEKSLATLERLFSKAKMQDVRSKPVYDGARELFGQLQIDSAKRNESEAFKLVQNYKAELECLSGFPIRIQEDDLKNKVGATIQMAWKHKRDFHLVKIRANYPAPLVQHLESHELTHLKLESEARKVAKNQFFVLSPKSRETAILAIANDVRKWEKVGFSEQRITDVSLNLIQGACEFVFNCPIDMLIERHLRQSFPVLRPAQFLSVRLLASEAAKTNTNKEVREFTPKKILQASLALNGAYALFLDDLFCGASEFAGVYRSESTFGLSRRLWQHWQERASRLSAGEEYKLVDEFADMVGLRGWYEWRPDPGEHEVSAEPLKEGTTNPGLLKAKQTAAVFYFLDAFKRFDAMSPDDANRVGKEAAFRNILAQHCLKPEEVLVVGDNPDSEIEADNRIGITTVRILHPSVRPGNIAKHTIKRLAELKPLISGVREE